MLRPLTLADRADLARAARSAGAMALAWILAAWLGAGSMAMFVAPAAQNVAMHELRGDGRARASLLGVSVLAAVVSAVAGTLSGGSLVAAMIAAGLLGAWAAFWQRASVAQGAQLVITSAVLFFLGISHPGDASRAGAAGLWTTLGASVGVVVQLATSSRGALRLAAADAWVAAAEAIRGLGQGRADQVPLGPMRAAVDRAHRLLGGYPDLDGASELAARIATRAFAVCSVVGKDQAAGPARRREVLFEAVAAAVEATAQVLAAPSSRRRAAATAAREQALRAIDETARELAGRPRASRLLARLGDAARKMPTDGVDPTHDAARERARLPWIEASRPRDARHAARLVVLLALAVGLYKYFAIPRGYWLALTILVVLQPDYGSTRTKAIRRTVGTLVGVGAATGLLMLPLGRAGFAALAIVAAFGFVLAVRRRYDVAVALVTAMLVLMTEATSPVETSFFVTRVLATLGGALVALLTAGFAWPDREHTALRSSFRAALGAQRAFLEAIAGALLERRGFTGEVVEHKRRAERATHELSGALTRFAAEPRPDPRQLEAALGLGEHAVRLYASLTVLAQSLDLAPSFDEERLRSSVARVLGRLAAAEAGRLAAPSEGGAGCSAATPGDEIDEQMVVISAHAAALARGRWLSVKSEDEVPEGG